MYFKTQKVHEWLTGNPLFRALMLVSITALSLVACSPKAKLSVSNTLRMYSDAKFSGLDPIQSGDQYAAAEVSRSYEGLLQYHYLKRPFELVPNLADGMPSISKDGLTYVFKIKKGVLFQDDPAFVATHGKGRELVASDFVYSWKRLADPKTVAKGWWIFDGKIQGLNEWREAAAKAGEANYALEVKGLKALDRYTLEVKLKQRSAQFLFFVAMPFSYVVAKEVVEKYSKDFMNHPVGTGPYRLVEFSPNSRVIWERNPTFRGEKYPSEGEQTDSADALLADSGKQIPFIDRIEVTVFEESQPLWLNFLAGKIDVTRIPKDNYDAAIEGDPKNPRLKEELRVKGIRLSKATDLDFTKISFNLADPLVGKNKYLRQALSLAYDPVKAIELFRNGRAEVAQGPIPPGLSGFDPKWRNPYQGPNLLKAKELMEKAGYPGGKGLPPLEYLTTASTNSRQWAEYTEKQWAPLGVKLKVISASWPEYDQSVKNKKGQIFADTSWYADYPDAENFLQLLYSKNASPGTNDTNYSNPEYDRLYEASLLLEESPARTELYRKMVQIASEDCPWIPLSHLMRFGLRQNYVRNVKVNIMELAPQKYWRLIRDQKEDP